MSSPACVLEPTAPVPVDPYLFGLNTLLGQIDNLPFEDPTLLRAARTLGAGAFRWPGGGLADSWSLVDGRYDDHAKSAWANFWAPRTAWAVFIGVAKFIRRPQGVARVFNSLL